MTRTNYSSGAPLEESVGYSRMVKVGNIVMIGGTTAVQPDGTVYGETAYEQAKYIFTKQVKLLEQAGVSAKDVVKVNGFVTDIKFGGEVSKAYSEFFHDVKPLFTLVGTPALNRPTQFVELDLTAIILE
ncbi:MAG: Rid family hydrolase [Clostridia bacterium]